MTAMLKLVDSKSRRLIASALTHAFAGSKDAALDLLAHSSSDENTSAALAMTRAHIHYLDGDYAMALGEFDEHTMPLVDQLPVESRTVVMANRNDVRLAMSDFTAVADHYQNQDLVRTLRGSREPSTKIAAADEAARREDHREAIALLWSGVVDAYESGIWAQLRANRERMARECCAVDWYSEATAHAIASGKDAVAFVANQLLQRADRSAIEASVRSMLSGAHLLEHRAAAATMVERLRDVIPDNLVNPVFEWALEGCRRATYTREIAERVELSWRAVLALLFRSSAEQTRAAVDLALNHPILTSFVVQRASLIRVLEASVSKLDDIQIKQVTDRCLDLLGPLRHDLDYQRALGLARALALNVSGPVVAKIADAVVPQGTPIKDLRLTPLAVRLGRSVAPEELERLVEIVTKRLRKQVQRLSGNEPPVVNITHLGRMERDYKGGRVTVLFSGALTEVDAMVALKNFLSPAQIQALAEAALEMIDEPLNLPPNRNALLSALAELSDHFDSETSKLVFDRLKPHTLQQVKYEWQELGSSPLSPFTLDMDSDDDTAGMALYCLACLTGGHSTEAQVAEIESIVAFALVGVNEPIRQAAAAASTKLAALSDAVLDGLVSCTRDSSPKVAAFAYLTLSGRSDLLLNESQWHFLSAALRSSLSGGDSSVRRAASRCIRCLKRTAVSQPQTDLVRDLENIVASDICFSVRQETGLEQGQDIEANT
ncbi:MAG TPA: hypothetical protein VGN17_05405 [Bryobacteraceae bacterium]|jgi:hypothetical protein